MAPNRGGQGKEPSISSGGASSEGSSHGSDASIGVLKDQEAGDLLRGSSASKKEVFFPAIYFLFDNRILERDIRFVVLHTLFTWVQLLNLFFSPNFFGWDVDWNGNNWWRFYKRLLLSNAVVERGWTVYVGALVVFIVACVGCAAVSTWLTFVLKTRTKFRWKWPGHLLRVIVTLCWGSFLTSFISLLTVAYTCNNDSRRTMYYFPSRGCFAMPQVVLFAIGLVVTLVCVLPALHSLLIDCGDTDFRSSNYLSSSVGCYTMRMGLVKMFLPLVPMMFQLFPRWHGVFNFCLTSYLLYVTVRRVPMHRAWLNCVHAFLNAFLWWAAALGLLGIYYPQYWPGLTIAFLAGMVPLGLVFAAIAHYRQRRMWQVAQLFTAWTPQTPLRETHRFWDEYEVELVARVCRQTVVTETLDVVPDPRWTNLADRALQAGLAQFPDSAFLNLVYASLQAVLLNDPSGGMAQLQRARKCSDITWVQRFQVYVREQTKLAQKGRDQDQSSTFDAVTWAEFQSNYKLAIRTHRGALTSLKSFWHLLLRSDVSMVALVRHFLRIESSREAAERSYKAVMERYPNNPRVLRAYARFLQQVKNDPNGASRYNALADKVEEQQDESRRELIFSQIIDRKFKDEASTKVMAMIDETTDAVIIINPEGMIQYANLPSLKMFGYRKGELEGKNISMLMPAPFSQQHDGYLRTYMSSRRARILDTTREVVALHKQRHVFPVSLCVTPIMMGAAECFLGVIKPLEDDSTMATAYCTANGTVVCINRGFSNLFAWQSTDVIGHAFHDYTTQHEKFNQIIAAVTASDGQEKAFGKLTIMHKFGEEMDVEVLGRRAGTDAVRITVLEMTAGANKFTGLITVSPATARITYTNASFCEMVGIPADHLIKMRLHEIMPEPYAMLHQRWIKGRDLSRAPSLKCRAGRVVEFKHSSGKLVSAVLEIGERSTDAGNMFTVKVAPIKEKDKADVEWNRISLTITPGATIDSHVGKLALFGMDREALVGNPLDTLLDLYRKEGVELAAIHAKLLEELKDNPRTLRVAVAPRGKRTVPAVMQLLPPAEEGGPSTMHLYRADCLEGVIELDAACKVKKCSEEAALLFGLPAAELVGEHIHKVLPKVCPQGKTSELLAARGQRGGAKRSIGAVVAAEGVHPDKRPMHVSLQAAESMERPGRYLVRIIVPKPTSSYSTAGGRPGTGAAPSQLPAGLSASGAGSTGAAAKPSLLGSLTGFIPGMSGSPPATGGGCPFHFGAASATAVEPEADALPAPAAAAAADPASPSRPTTGGGCPFGFGSRASGGASRDPSTAAAVTSRPVTGGSACPINLNTEEVLSSLSFPPTSRFALQKAHAEAAAATSAERSRQATPTEEDGRDPNQDGESQSLPASTPSPPGTAAQGGLQPGCGTAAAAAAAAPAGQPSLRQGEGTAEQLLEGEVKDAAAALPTAPAGAADSEGGGRPGTGWDTGLVYGRKDRHYDQPTASFRFKELSKLPRLPTAASQPSHRQARPVMAGAERGALARQEEAPPPGTDSIDLLVATQQRQQQQQRQQPQQEQEQGAASATASATVMAQMPAPFPEPLLLGGAGREAGPLPEASLPKEDSTAVLVTARPAGSQDAGADAGGAPNHESEQHSGSEQEGEEGGEDEMDPEELAKKMALVQQWLQDTATSEAPVGTPAAAGPPGTAASRPRTAVSAAAAGTTVVELPVAPAAAQGGCKELVPLAGGEAGALVASKAAGAAVKAADHTTAETSSQPDSDAASMVTDDNDEGADYSRLKRYRKAYKLLNSARARRAINNLQVQLKYVLAGLVLVHVACFATSLIVLNSSLAYVSNVDKAGQAARNAISVCTDMRTIQWASKEIKETGTWHFGDPYMAARNLVTKAQVLEDYQNSLYFAKGSAAAATSDIYENTMLENLVFINVKPTPMTVPVNMSLWDSTQRLINAAKEIAAMSLEDWFDISKAMSYRFAMDNAPNTISEKLLKVVDMEAYMAVEKLKQVGLVTWVLLGIEAGLVIPLCALYIYRLLRQVAIERFNLFSIFLFIPRPALLALARAEVIVDELDESSDDDDELAAIAGGGGTGAGGGATAVNTAVNARALAQKAAQNKLAVSRRAILWLMLPFAVWLAVAVACWGLQFYWVNSATERVMGLDASERAFVYNARVRFYATQLAVKANDKNTDDDESRDLRSRLDLAATRMQFWHETILYGDDSNYRPLDQSAHNLARHNYPKLHFVSTMYSNLQRNKLLYDEQCLKPNKTQCYSKDDTLYQTTNFGLNNMVYYYVEQAKSLAVENIVDIVTSHPSVKYIFTVGVEDMLGGWSESNRIFMYIANFTYTRALQGVVLAFVIVGALAFQYFQARPYLRTTQLESKKVAEVVSYCPQGVDVAALMEMACVSADAAGGGGGGRSLQRSSSKSSDQEFA